MDRLELPPRRVAAAAPIPRMASLTFAAPPRAVALTSMILSLVVLSACGGTGVVGAGPTGREVREVDAFSGVEVDNGIGLTLVVGDPQAVEVSAQENILPLVRTMVESGTLRIHSIESFTTTAGVIVSVTVPALDGISVSGGSEAQIEGMASDNLDVVMSGGARLTAAGRSSNVTFAGSGGSRSDLAALDVKTMAVELSEGATAALRVSDRLTGTASGGAVATITGEAVLDVQTSGGASVTNH